MPKSFKWNENSSVLFQESLATTKIQTKIENFNRKDYLNNTGKMVDDLNNIYYEAAFTSLQEKKKKKTQSNNNTKNKSKWMDMSLSKF